MKRSIISIFAIYCLLYTSDAADEEDSVDLGGRRIIKKKENYNIRLNEIKYTALSLDEIRWE